MGYPRQKWNSIINKTPISYSTNREIGGWAPSRYLSRLETKGKVSAPVLNSYLESHWLDVTCCRTDNFDQFIIERTKKLLAAIEQATGKVISGKDSDEVVARFGAKLI